MKLVPVDSSDKDHCLNLWALLGEREPHVNISHKTMPTWDDHCLFIERHPYKAWYLIEADDPDNDDFAGSIYLSQQNEIGIFIFKEYQGRGYGRGAIMLLMREHPEKQYLANINPENTESMQFFERLGFDLLQVTYGKDNA